MPDLIWIEKRCVFRLGIINTFYEMRRIVISFIGDHTHGIGHLQRSHPHFILANTEGQIGTAAPAAAIFLVIYRCIGNKASVFAGQIHTQPVAPAKTVEIFTPFHVSFFYTTILRIVSSQAIHVSEIRVATKGNSVPKIGGVTAAAVKALGLANTTADIITGTGIAKGGSNESLIQSDQCTQRFKGRARLITALDSPVQKRIGHIEQHA